MKQHHREIYVYISRLTSASDDTEDLFQETFLRAYRAYARLPEEANVRAWLFKIATNRCRNHARRLRRRPDMSLQAAPGALEHIPNQGTTPDDPEQLMLSKDLERQILAVIDRLPLKQKAALMQRKVHGLSYDSIATSLQCSPEAARAHVYQAFKRIREVFDETPGAATANPNPLVRAARAQL